MDQTSQTLLAFIGGLVIGAIASPLAIFLWAIGNATNENVEKGKVR